MGTVFAVHGALGRNGGQNGRNPLHVIAESHVKIPLIMNREGLHAARDRMMRKLFILGSPGRVHRPIDLKSAAYPIEKFFFAFLFGRLDGVMNANQTDAFVHQLSDGLQVIILEQWMAAAAVTVNHYGGCVRKGRLRIIRPTVAINHRANGRQFVEARFQ